jgi:putative ABC transport system permease protein
MKSNSRFYYKKKHFVAVSGLLYRMKQNGVGLASITILATMVLVMLSTTVSMYAGIGDTIERQYFHQMTMSSHYEADGKNEEISLEDLRQMAEQTAEEFDLVLSYTGQQRYLSCAICREGEAFLKDRKYVDLMDFGVSEAWFMTAEEYERLTGQTLSLGENEMVYYAQSGNESAFPDMLTLGDTTYRCLPNLTEYPVSMEGYAIVDCFGFVVPEESDLEDIYALQKEAYGEYASEMNDKLVLDFADEDRMGEVYDDYFTSLRAKIRAYVEVVPEADGGWGMSVDSKWGTIEYLYGMYGTLPLLVAAMHTAFAFPILTRLLRALFAADQMLFLGCTLGALAVFAILYVVIYSLTARTYYKLVRWE